MIATRILLLATLAAGTFVGAAEDWTLLTLDPGHFHAALFQRDMLPGIAEESWIYAPLGPDLAAHLNRVAAFNRRADHPTHWRLRVYSGPDYLERMLRERRGQLVVMSGRNRGKIGRIRACLEAGLHVLADKPWIIEASDFPQLAAALDTAAARQLVAYDAMTQRFEITFLLQRALVNDPEVFGAALAGTPAEPAVRAESRHYLLKEVAGLPNVRPAWFFDTSEQGEGLSDVGTHLADLVPWILFPGQPIQYEPEIRVLSAKRWPTILTAAEFQRVTGEPEFPASLQRHVQGGRLNYDCNNAVTYTVRGVHVRLETTWDFAARAGEQDTERLVFCGRRARIEMRQGPEQGYRREVYVTPQAGADRAGLAAALAACIARLQRDWPGVSVEEHAGQFRIHVPDRFRMSHEGHFAAVAQRFLDYARQPSTLPAWEKANLLATYYVTTHGVALARQDPTPR